MNSTEYHAPNWRKASGKHINSFIYIFIIDVCIAIERIIDTQWRWTRSFDRARQIYCIHVHCDCSGVKISAAVYIHAVGNRWCIGAREIAKSVAWMAKHSKYSNNNKHMRRVLCGRNENNQAKDWITQTTTKWMMMLMMGKQNRNHVQRTTYSKQ